MPTIPRNALVKRVMFAIMVTMSASLSGAGVLWAAAPELETPVSSSERATPLVNGLIVKFKPTLADKQPGSNGVAARTAALSRIAARTDTRVNQMKFARTLATGAEVFRFEQPMTLTEAQAIVTTLSADPLIAYATPNRRMSEQAIPVDADYRFQWGFRYNASEQGANFEAAWDITKGNASQTIGVVDSGIAKAHPDLASKLRVSPQFPNGGYDFFQMLNVTPQDTRDDDPEQTANVCGHGSHVSGTIAADTKFSGDGSTQGVAGGAPNAMLLMARALDATGDEADVIDGMLWLGGISVAGVAQNPNPVKVINMSLGGAGACAPAYQDAVEQLALLNVVVVAAAGNSTADVANFAPANCTGVIAVAASDIAGSLAWFSNRGTGITITAPGDSIWSSGGSSGGNCTKSGTSMAAPHVTAAVALAQSVSPNLTTPQMNLALRAGARPFPSGSDCTPALCGAGLLDAYRLIDRVDSTGPTTVGWLDGLKQVRENAGQISLSLARIGSSTVAVNVNVLPVSGTAVQGVDFGAPSPAQVTWAAGDTADKTVTVPIIARSGEQGARAFSVAIVASGSSLQLVSPTALPVTITEVDCNTVTSISFGETKSGDLGTPNTTYCRGGVRGPAYNTVRYRFNATAGTRATIMLNSTTTQGVLDPYVYLLDSNMQVLAENDDIRSGVLRNSLIDQFLIPTTGTYYIDVTSWSATQENTGTYTLSLFNCGPYTPTARCNLDVDGDGYFDRTDATLALRRMFGFSGAPLVADLSFRACALRVDGPSVASFVDAQSQVNASSGARPYDLDADDAVSPLTDGLLLLRFALGLDDASIGATAFNPLGNRNTSALARRYLSNACNNN